MSTFSDSWKQCMQANSLPVPDLETANEALEFLHKLHDAWENAGGEAELTIGALLVAGALAGTIGAGALEVLGEVAAVTVTLYLSACIACMGSVAIDDLKNLFASGQMPDFVVAELESQGIALENNAVA
jgi:hypothetical protein